MLSNETKYLSTSPEDGKPELPKVVVNYDVTAGTKYLVACDTKYSIVSQFGLYDMMHNCNLQLEIYSCSKLILRMIWYVQQQVMRFRNIWASLTGRLRLDGPGCESRMEKKIFIISKTVHSSSDARPAFCTMGTGVLPRGGEAAGT